MELAKEIVLTAGHLAVWSGGAGMLTVHLSSLHWAAAANSHHSANSRRPSLLAPAHAHNFSSHYFQRAIFLGNSERPFLCLD